MTEEKATVYSTALEKKVEALVENARKRRAYVHSMAMSCLTPKQYERCLPLLTKQGYGVNVFPVHHPHPPLSMTVYGCYVDAARALLEHGADPNMTYPTDQGRTSAIQEIVYALVKYNTVDPRRSVKLRKILHLMIQHGAKVDTTIKPGSTVTFRQILTEKNLGHLL